jgi:hypothetical protein
MTLKQVLQQEQVYLSMVNARFFNDFSGLETSAPQFGHLTILSHPFASSNLFIRISNI